MKDSLHFIVRVSCNNNNKKKNDDDDDDDNNNNSSSMRTKLNIVISSSFSKRTNYALTLSACRLSMIKCTQDQKKSNVGSLV